MKGQRSEEAGEEKRECGEKYLCALNNVKRWKAYAVLSRGQRGA